MIARRFETARAAKQRVVTWLTWIASLPAPLVNTPAPRHSLRTSNTHTHHLINCRRSARLIVFTPAHSTAAYWLHRPSSRSQHAVVLMLNHQSDDECVTCLALRHRRWAARRQWNLRRYNQHCHRCADDITHRATRIMRQWHQHRCKQRWDTVQVEGKRYAVFPPTVFVTYVITAHTQSYVYVDSGIATAVLCPAVNQPVVEQLTSCGSTETFSTLKISWWNSNGVGNVVGLDQRS